MDAALLARFALLEGFSQDQVEILSPIMLDVQYQAHQTVFEQGARADYLYFVIDGRVSIRFKPEDGPVLAVADVREGGVFGWSSALGSTCYTSSAICTKDGLFVRIAGEDLKTLCQDYPNTGILILNRLAGVIAQRLRGTHDQVVELLHKGLNQTEPGGC
jgi:CRP/FNR family cyclic AMP-dependent transcriptional regulator